MSTSSLWHNSHESMALSYKKIIKQMAAQAPKVYGEIPPLTKKKKKKKSNDILSTHHQQRSPPSPISRRMSHVENWVVVDSKESLPDEEDLVQRSPLRNFLSIDFLTDVLPLHTPPASLSDSSALVQQYEIAKLANQLKETRLLSASISDPSLISTIKKSELEIESLNKDHQQQNHQHPTTTQKSPSVRRNSISSTSNAQIPSISTTQSSVTSSGNRYSTPDIIQQMKWLQNMNKLKKTLLDFGKQQQRMQLQENKKKKIPMPELPPSMKNNHRRRSEATTQPRYNPESNTYTRDTRYNPDHLRMIAAELNMMRARKLLSPLKPRGFLPRRKDVVYLANDRRRSPLINEVIVVEY